MANLYLVLGVLTISSLVVLSNGFNFENFRSKRQAEEFPPTDRPNNGGGGDCRFPRRAFRCDCCTMPDEILGNLTGSFKTCFGKKWEEYKKQMQMHHQDQNHRRDERYRYSQRQEEADDDGATNPEDDSGEGPPRDGPEDREGGPGGRDPDDIDGQDPDRPSGGEPERPSGGEPERPSGGEPERPSGGNPEGPGGRGPGGPGGRGPGGRGPGGPGGRGPGGPGRGPGGRGPPDGHGPDCDRGRGGQRRGYHWRGGPKDGCLMECVFEKEDWLENGKVNVEKIMKRIEDSKTPENSIWVQAALDAVMKCRGNAVAEEGKKCQSGSEEFFMCMGKEIFINCPEFRSENEGCDTLKDFYKRCPAPYPVPLKCHNHGPAKGNGEMPPMGYRRGGGHHDHDDDRSHRGHYNRH